MKVKKKVIVSFELTTEETRILISILSIVSSGVVPSKWAEKETNFSSEFIETTDNNISPLENFEYPE